MLRLPAVYGLSHLCAAIALGLAFATPAQAEERPLAELPVPVIAVAGEGRASAAPDLAILSLGVTREAETAKEALDANNQAMTAVIDALKSEGIEAKDLQTSGFSVQPRYVYPRQKSDGTQEPPHIVGYAVSNNLTVKVRVMNKVGELLDMVVTLGMNSGGNISFTNSDPAPLIASARASAMKDARSRAETLAAAAGIKLGQILEIREDYREARPVVLTRGKAFGAEAADAVPIEAGETTYNVNVQVQFEILQ